MDISNAIITGGVFTVTSNIWLQSHWEAPLRFLRSMDRFLEAVAPSAFHNSVERGDPVHKSHYVNTVVDADLSKRIRRWASQCHQQTQHNDDGSNVIYSVPVPMPILWLAGHAGSGKSALAQSFAEELDTQRRLLASFFFGRSDDTRNHPRALIATLAYQIYQTVPISFHDRILAVIDRLIFRRSMAAQFERLVLALLHDLLEQGYFDGAMAPWVVVIDGLDECLDAVMRRRVLDMICDSVIRYQLPSIFLISCRPELDLQLSFDSHRKIVETLVLENEHLSMESLDKEQHQPG